MIIFLGSELPKRATHFRTWIFIFIYIDNCFLLWEKLTNTYLISSRKRYEGAASYYIALPSLKRVLKLVLFEEIYTDNKEFIVTFFIVSLKSIQIILNWFHVCVNKEPWERTIYLLFRIFLDLFLLIIFNIMWVNEKIGD